MKGVQQLYGLEYLDDFWKRRSNLDMASLFVALALLVGGSKDEVQWLVAASVDRQWLLRLDEIIEQVILGVGIEMGYKP